MRLALFLSVVLAATPVAVLAQRAAGLSGRDIPAPERARDTMNRFAACVVRARPTLVMRALAEPSRAKRIVALNDVVKRECLAGGTLRMDPVVFEGALYRALYLREFGRNSPDVQALAAGEPVTAAFPLQVFGDCVVRTAPAEAHAFLASAPVTPEENAALAGLGPAFTACVPAEDQFRFSPALLQAVLAEALYKRATKAAHRLAAGGGAMRLLAALLIALSSAESVAAQDTDQRQMAANDGPIWSLREDSEFLSAMQKYGECAARDVSMQSRFVMRDLPGSEQSSQALFWTLLGSNSCTDNGRTPSALPAAYRGVVAEFYLERDFELPAFSRKRGPLKVFSERDASDPVELTTEARTALPYILAGSCLAKAEPAGLTALFAASPSSAEEFSALQLLEPHSVECIPSGAPPLTSTFQLRGYLAEGAYRYGVTKEAAE